MGDRHLAHDGPRAGGGCLVTAPEIASVSRLIDQERVNRYAVAARDMNPIHRETSEAYAGPFGRPAAHGMLALALLSEALTNALGERWTEHGVLKVRWRSPALPPCTVTARATLRSEEGGIATYDVICENDQGDTILQGTASVPVEP
jgi:3-hydroxybutyryl-CoA dehydratase